MKYLIYTILFSILFALNLFTQIFVFRKFQDDNKLDVETLKSINFMLYGISIILFLFIGVCLYIHISGFKFKDQISDNGFSMIFGVISLLYFIQIMNMLKLNVSDKNTFEYKFLSIYFGLSLLILPMSFMFIDTTSLMYVCKILN